MTNTEKTELFKVAHAQLKMCLAFSDALKDSPTASLDTTARFMAQMAKAQQAAMAFDNAMREVTEHPTAQG